MNSKMKPRQIISALLLAAVFVSSCGAGEETEIAVIVALTQTAAALQQPVDSAPQTEAVTVPQTEVAVAPQTEAPAQPATEAPAPPSGYQPYDSASCANLNAALSAGVGLTGSVSSPVPFNDFITGQSGSACQVFYTATGATVPPGDMYAKAISAFQGLGWTEDANYAAGGPSGFATAFRKETTLCLMAYERKPIDRALCNPDEIFASCMDRLAPEQKLINLTLTCSTLYP